MPAITVRETICLFLASMESSSNPSARNDTFPASEGGPDVAGPMLRRLAGREALLVVSLSRPNESVQGFCALKFVTTVALSGRGGKGTAVEPVEAASAIPCPPLRFAFLRLSSAASKSASRLLGLLLI